MKRKAGSIVVDDLRDRILLGRYFSRWQGGDRLPSVRDVAELEGVDRKTAAAAYRRLDETGLVRVRPRSGVYLRPGRRDDSGDPLRRLHLQWLEQTLASAGELGMGPGRISELLQAVLVVEQQPIPVLDPDLEHAELLAAELGQRTGFHFRGVDGDGVKKARNEIREALLLIATPAVAGSLRTSRIRTPLVEASLTGSLLDAVRTARDGGSVNVAVPTEALRGSLEAAVARGLVPGDGAVAVVRVSTQSHTDRLCASGERLVLWPGVPGPGNVRKDITDLRSTHLLSHRTVADIRHQVARLALDRVSRSSGDSRTG